MTIIYRYSLHIELFLISIVLLLSQNQKIKGCHYSIFVTNLISFNLFCFIENQTRLIRFQLKIVKY